MTSCLLCDGPDDRYYMRIRDRDGDLTVDMGSPNFYLCRDCARDRSETIMPEDVEAGNWVANTPNGSKFWRIDLRPEEKTLITILGA